MANIGLVLMVFAFVCAVVAAWWNPPNWNLIAISLAFFNAAVIFGNVGPLLVHR